MSDRPSTKLIRTIEGDIVPRLLVALAGKMRTSGEAAAQPAKAAEPDSVAEFARLLLRPEAAGAAAFVRQIYPRGTPVDRICLGLMAPAARRLGELWEHEECDFEQFIAGLGRIESLLREVGMDLR